MSESSIRIEVNADLEDLIPGFLKNRRTDVKAIEEAVQSNDLDRIRVIGHSMKGAGGGYGFDGVTDIGAVIEQAAIDQNPERILAAARQLSDYLDRVDVVFV
jgi:HPt (histidine-containing phosphotransfer) domain-containing protein